MELELAVMHSKPDLKSFKTKTKDRTETLTENTCKQF